MSNRCSPRGCLWSLLTLAACFVVAACSSGGSPPATATCSASRPCPDGLVCVVDKGLCALPGGGGEDMTRGADLADGVTRDMADGVMRDMAGPIRDMAGPAADMAGPAADMAGPASDMAMPDMMMPDMDGTTTDMATPDLGGSMGGDMGMTPPSGPRVCPAEHLCWENPLPQPRDLRAVWGTAPSDVWAVGELGVAMHYDGANWAQFPTGTSQTLQAVWGRAPNQVWMVGTAGTILFWDGTRFTAQASGTGQSLYGVWGIGSVVWAVGAGGVILKWDGTSWSTAPSGTVSYLYAIWGFSGSDIWAAGESGMVCHFGGTSWTCGREFSGDVLALTGSSPSELWALGAMSTAQRWDGARWTGVTRPISTVTLRAAATIGPKNIWAVGDGGQAINWNGTSWTVVPAVASVGLTGVWGGSASTVLAVGSQGMLQRYDGTAWNIASSNFGSSSVTAMWGASERDLWVFTSDGMAHHYNGAGWMNTALGGTIYSVTGTASNNIWAGSDGGNVYRYNGSSWVKSVTREASVIHGIYIAASDRVVLTQDGSIQFWDGARYTTSTMPTSVQVPTWGTGPNNIWTAGAGCTYYRYDGSTWTTGSIPGCSGTILGIHGTGASNIYFASQSSSDLFRWDGSRFNAVTGTGSFNGKTAVFAAGGRVYATTTGGEVLQSSGGAWSTLVNVRSRLDGIAGFGPDSLWVGGYNGFVLSYKP